MSIDVSRRLSLGRAHQLAWTAIREIRRAGLPVDSVTSVGSLRRFAPEIGSVSLLAIAPANRVDEVLAGFGELAMAAGVSARTPDSATIATDRGPITLHVAPPAQRGIALVWLTGSRAHRERLAVRAARLGMRFEEGRLTRGGGRVVEAASEPLVYRLLGLPFIPPELREGGDEVDAAERGDLPALIADSDIRGDLHMHTTWSDGRDSTESMIQASRQLGYEYVAITDHSHRSFASRTLSAADVALQRSEIVALRERISGITILHGVEVDIMKDGSLDFDDEVLEQFDIVLASLHDHGGQTAAELNARYLKAIAHPMVNVITHPANRTPALSRGYDLDFDQLFAAARETGTALEIDGAPGHLDMDCAVARRAVAAGVTVTVDSDCHRTDALARQMRFGVGTARRGWVGPHHVLNARGIDEVRAFLAAKRARA